MDNIAAALRGLDMTTIFLMATAFCVVGALGYLGVTFLEGTQNRHVRRRLAEATRVAKEPGGPSLKALSKATIKRNDADGIGEGGLKGLLPNLILLQDRLDASGMKLTVNIYLVISFVVGGLVFLLCKVSFSQSLAVSLLMGIGMGFYFPHKFINMAITGRQNKFMALFPEAIELMVRGLKSGVPIAESMRAVGKEIPDPVGESFRTVTDSMVMGRTFGEALGAESRRLKLADFHFFEISLGIQQETGGNLAETLEGLATTLRRRKQMKLKIKALSSEARATAYILGSLPFVMFGLLDLVDPKYMNVLLDDPRGHGVLGAAIFLLILGVFTMVKMGQFEI